MAPVGVGSHGRASRAMTMTVEVQPRFQVLPSGIRIVRLGPTDHGWLAEYRAILDRSVQDFLRRAHVPGTPAAVLEELAGSLAIPTRAVWLVLRPDYGLLGFALAELRALFGAPPEVFCLAAYLYPRRPARGIFPGLVRVMLEWGRGHGATTGTFQTSRVKPRAWARVGAQPTATIYTVPMPSDGGH
jgi:hypothetical protein